MGLVRDFSAYENAILGYHLDPEYSRHGLLEHARHHRHLPAPGCAATTSVPTTRC